MQKIQTGNCTYNKNINTYIFYFIIFKNLHIILLLFLYTYFLLFFNFYVFLFKSYKKKTSFNLLYILLIYVYITKNVINYINISFILYFTIITLQKLLIHIPREKRHLFVGLKKHLFSFFY